MTTRDPLLHAALSYARAELAVFPGHCINTDGHCSCGRPRCSSPGKHPRIRQWHTKATVDENAILDWWRRWPSANVCIATGKVSGVVVLDIDPRHGGEDSLKALEESSGPLPVTPVTRTGGGGLHFFFQHPGRRVPNRVDILPGIDFRGDGGFVVVPPSNHESGDLYSWKTQLVQS